MRMQDIRKGSVVNNGVRARKVKKIIEVLLVRDQLVMYRIVQSPDEDEIGKTGTCTLKSLARWGEGFGRLEE